MIVAVIGLGSIGARHARNLLALGHEVIAFDPAPAADELPVPMAGSLEAALTKADAAIVASPTSLHAEHAAAAIDHGTAVLVEKPLAVEAAAAERLVERASEHRVVAGVAMNLRFHPAIESLRALLREEALGPIQLAHVWCGSDLREWRPGRDYRTTYSARAELGGGIVRDAIHELDYATWLLGTPQSVTGEVAHVSELEVDVEDQAVAILRLAGGLLVAVDLSFAEPVYRRGCLLVGARASARWDWTAETIEISRAGAPVQLVHVPADINATYVAELRDFLAAAQSDGTPRTTLAEGAQAVRVAEALLRSASTGTRVSL